MPTQGSSIFMVLGVIGFMVASLMPTYAEEPGAIVDGAGFTLYGLESIKSDSAATVERDPICDRSKRPRIVKVEPDEVKSGETIVITGENFGTKECFRTVTFSAASKTPIDFKFMNGI